MKLSTTVLGVMRGGVLGGAVIALAVGCSTPSPSVEREPAARLAPVPVPAAPTAPPAAPLPPATIVPIPDPTPSAPTIGELAAQEDEADAGRRHHRSTQIHVGHHPIDMHPACGRG